MQANFEPILPGSFSSEVFLDAFTELIRETIEEADNDFEKTYETWRHNPGFQKDVDVSSKEIVGSVTTEDPIYGFVTRGTAVRYATMTPGFVPKTQRRILGSGPGRGGVLYVSKRHPRPGIQAREFEQVVKERIEPKFQRKGQKVLDEAAKRSGHGI